LPVFLEGIALVSLQPDAGFSGGVEKFGLCYFAYVVAAGVVHTGYGGTGPVVVYAVGLVLYVSAHLQGEEFIAYVGRGCRAGVVGGAGGQRQDNI
jgi:hypothetical protein